MALQCKLPNRLNATDIVFFLHVHKEKQQENTGGT